MSGGLEHQNSRYSRGAGALIELLPEFLRQSREQILVCPFIFRAMTDEDHAQLAATNNEIYFGRSRDMRCSDYIDLIKLLAVRDERWPSQDYDMPEYIENIVGIWLATEFLEPRFKASADQHLMRWQGLMAIHRAVRS